MIDTLAVDFKSISGNPWIRLGGGCESTNNLCDALIYCGTVGMFAIVVGHSASHA